MVYFPLTVYSTCVDEDDTDLISLQDSLRERYDEKLPDSDDPAKSLAITGFSEISDLSVKRILRHDAPKDWSKLLVAHQLYGTVEDARGVSSRVATIADDLQISVASDIAKICDRGLISTSQAQSLLYKCSTLVQPNAWSEFEIYFCFLQGMWLLQRGYWKPFSAHTTSTRYNHVSLLEACTEYLSGLSRIAKVSLFSPEYMSKTLTLEIRFTTYKPCFLLTDRTIREFQTLANTIDYPYGDTFSRIEGQWHLRTSREAELDLVDQLRLWLQTVLYSSTTAHWKQWEFFLFFDPKG